MKTKQFSAKPKFECNICDFKTNSKKEFSDHRGFVVHKDAAMKKLQKEMGLDN